ncbi:DUF7931 domain-containing protein [Jeongeupia chitinilytica]|uniref:DUF7931 domain-containing protein n=1 Tax=Jeongeupia chitinilytica TaxID=1041641 RepID=A0ABQ3GX40_9NEIS|nr:hypothetical protein [Jeongeupia chitinilytica]GHD57889.1 hypothetical protein GCM10007350_06870 [Jeongeupia chitinilytica]
MASFTLPAEPPVAIDRHRDYAEAFAALVASARRTLLLAEDDFRLADLGSRAVCDGLWTFFVGGGELKLLAWRSGYLASAAPRFMQLRDRFGHRMQLMRVAEDDGTSAQGLAIADGQHYLKRHHADWPHATLGSNPADVALLQQQFDALWASAQPESAWNRLYI